MLRNVLIIFLIALASAAPLPLAAQAELRARMEAFLREIPDVPNDEMAAFFPRRGDWTWVQTLREYRGDTRRTETWRFPGVETARVIGADGPACTSFDVGGGEFGPFEGRLGMHALMHRGPWRRVRGSRFVPPGAPAGSPVFVEWRREEGEWVVSAFGDEDVYFSSPRLLGRPVSAFSPDTALVPEGVAFAPADWHMITLGWRRYLKYGLPRALRRDQLTRVGVYQRVSVYVERGTDTRDPEVAYLATAPGEYQPYQTQIRTPCR